MDRTEAIKQLGLDLRQSQEFMFLASKNVLTETCPYQFSIERPIGECHVAIRAILEAETLKQGNRWGYYVFQLNEGVVFCFENAADCAYARLLVE